MEIFNIKSGGIVCRTDAGLYDEGNTLYFLSVYGSPQQVRGIFSSLAMGRNVQLLTGSLMIELRRDNSDTLKFKGIKIGYGKQHAIIWNESLGKDIIFWLSQEERLKVFCNAFNKRKIPYDKEWLQRLEVILGREGYLSEIKGWGGANGYICDWNDEDICDLIVEMFVKNNKKDNRVAPVAGINISEKEYDTSQDDYCDACKHLGATSCIGLRNGCWEQF